MTVEFKIDGLDQVEARLKKLRNPKVIKNIARKSSRRGMNIVRDSARNNAKAIDDPETAEKIWKNISTQGGKSRNVNEIVMRVGVRGGASFSNKNPPDTPGGDTRHWRFIVLGTSKQPPIPFMQMALSTNIQPVTNKFAEEFNKELDKELLK
jgi:HK97 gp10 family phage protein